MKKREPDLFCISLLLITILLINCSSPNIHIDKSKPLPPVVKLYKHVTVAGGVSGLRDTGVDIERTDSVTILATGSINFCPKPYCPATYQNVTPELGWPLIARVGGKDSHYFRPLVRGQNSGNFSGREGKLYLGYKTGALAFNGAALNPDYYKDDIGAFSVDIIIWANNDYIQIAGFLEKQLARDPENKALEYELARFNMLKRYQIAEQEAEKEAEKTQKEISELQEKAAAQPTSTAENRQVRELEARLASLQATLAELDQMKKQLQQEQQKSEQLT
ncbi:MAG: hypothetical protein AMJ54_15750, partial [Deltaproteobacteria bacterium SG8_13]